MFFLSWIRNTYEPTESTLSMSDCHQPFITLIHWIKNDHAKLQMIIIDS